MPLRKLFGIIAISNGEALKVGQKVRNEFYDVNHPASVGWLVVNEIHNLWFHLSNDPIVTLFHSTHILVCNDSHPMRGSCRQNTLIGIYLTINFKILLLLLEYALAIYMPEANSVVEML